MSTKQDNWIVIAICGVTCGGKSTLANDLQQYFPNSKVINQDTYFYPDDSPKHIRCNNLDHVNYDVLSSLDMERMLRDILAVLQEQRNGSATNSINGYQTTSQREETEISCALQTKNILILEGFCLLNYPPIMELCDFKFEICITKEECCRRRSFREYDPPDIPGYFEQCVWPEYLKHKEELAVHSDIIPLDGTKDDLLDTVLHHVNARFKCNSTQR